MKDFTIIGFDASTQAAKTGLSLGRLSQNGIMIDETVVKPKNVVEVISTWIRDSRSPVLVAVDSPLGWSNMMGPALVGHSAGTRVNGELRTFFDRQTDRAVRSRIGSRPLSVGADLIGRTCLATLNLLDEVRERTGGMELLWNHDVDFESGLVEVYPASILRVHGQIDAGYKNKTDDSRERRQQIRSWLGQVVSVGPKTDPLFDNDDALDSALCVFAGAEFLMGRAVAPDVVTEGIRTEGWIWTCEGSHVK